MPRVEIEDAGTFDVEEGKRLVLALEEDAGVASYIAAAPTPDARPAG